MTKLESGVLKKKIDLQTQKVRILEDELNNSWDANKKLKRIVRKSHLVIQSQKVGQFANDPVVMNYLISY